MGRPWGCQSWSRGTLLLIRDRPPTNPGARLSLQVPRLHPGADLLHLHLLPHVQEAHQCCQGEAGLAVSKNAGDAGLPQKSTLVEWSESYSLTGVTEMNGLHMANPHF